MNLGEFETRGVDFETSYFLPLQNISSGMRGSLNFRLLTSLLYNMTIDAGLGSAPVNYAGAVRADGRVRWVRRHGGGQFLRDLRKRAVRCDGAGAVRGAGQVIRRSASGGAPIAPGDAGYASTNPNSINDNSVASAVYVNLSGSYRCGAHRNRLFATVDNITDRDPPVAPGGNGYPTNPV